METISRRTAIASGGFAALLATGRGFTAVAEASGSPTRDASDTCPPQADQLAYQRAIEAVIWSMPAMSDVFFRDSLVRDFGMQAGDVLVMSKPLVARHEVLTANNQVNYAAIHYDLTRGPWVIEIPPSNADYAIIGEICDNWQAPITMVGVPGPDRGRGGKYLLLPPGSKNSPASGYIPVRLEGYRGMMVFRPVVVAKGTMEGSVALARQTKSYPLGNTAGSNQTRVLDGWDKSWHSLAVYDVTWFEKLAKFVNDEPIRKRDELMVGMLSSLGIGKGTSFAPSESAVKMLNAAVSAAYQIMQSGFVTPGVALAPWWPDGVWMNMNPAYLKIMGEGWSYQTADAVYSYQRAVTPFFWANYLPIKLGGDQLYLMGLRDTTGALLSGQASYRLRVPANVPVDKFWSAILYSQKTKSFVPNQLNRVGLDSYEKSKLKPNADGSVDIYLGANAPSGYEQNWLPSAGEDFFVIFRFYGPAKSVYEKTWRLPDIERV
jgi:hypothetical protein